jgi:hypothetical protein
MTLDQLIGELPAAKRPQTWKRWLYERTRRGEIPGCVKLGGMLFFDRETRPRLAPSRRSHLLDARASEAAERFDPAYAR